jgi:hypothetical protein
VNHRDETKAADALAKAAENRGFSRHAFIIRMSEMPSYVVREIFGLMVATIRQIAIEADKPGGYHVWPDDVAADARIIWSRINDMYEGE